MFIHCIREEMKWFIHCIREEMKWFIHCIREEMIFFLLVAELCAPAVMCWKWRTSLVALNAQYARLQIESCVLWL